MQASQYLPGLMVAAMASLAAAWLSEHYGAPLILMGLLIGLAMNFVSGDPRTHAGLDLAGKTLLRLGIVILGLQITLADISQSGWAAFGALLAVMTAAILAAVITARILGQDRATGVLAGGATAICGASAALALYGVIGRDRLSQACFSLNLITITLASAFAMTVYPLIADALNLSPRATGFLMGASIHDVAQAIGAGFSVSPEVGEKATIVKLTRVALLAPIVALTALVFRPKASGGASRPIWAHLTMPWFIAGFLGLVIINSMLALPVAARTAGLDLSKALLLIAVTATAMRTTTALVLELSWKTAMPVVAATLASFGVAVAIAYFAM